MQTQLYKPREASTSNKNIFRFSEEQLEWIQAELGALIDFFEYNTGKTNFFPAVEPKNLPNFSQTNNSAL